MTRLTLTAFVSLAALAACTQEPAEPAAPAASIIEAAAATGASPTEYTLTWTTDVAGAPVTIEALTDPDAPAGSGVVIAEADTDGQLAWTATGEPVRHYFRLSTASGDTELTTVRVLPLEGGRNFRDLGGYRTSDGRVVKWGEVYRSGAMANLTPADYTYLSGLGVKVVCDFRNAQERADEPTNWQAGPAEYLSFEDTMDTGDNSALFAVFRDPDVTPEKVALTMEQFYPQILRDQDAAYTEMFDRLAAGETPLAFNCSAGKDRAGTAAALVLTALGVPRETIVEDYAMSDKVVDFMKEFFAASGEATAGAKPAEENAYAWMAQLPPELIAPLMASDPRYINATFASMEAQHGDALAWIKAELDVTEEELAAIRQNLLQ